jgi:hypothetical protein
VRVERGADLVLARVRVARQQRDGADDHAGNAIAALGRLLLEEGARDRVQPASRARPSSVTIARPWKAPAAGVVEAEPGTPLLLVLRNDLGLTAAKSGCGLEQCHACAVLIDGEARTTCPTRR